MNTEDNAWAATEILWAALLALLIIGSWEAMIIVAAVTGAALGAVTALERCRRAGRDIDQALAVVCRPCNGEAGRCTCTSRCGHLDCIGDHTTFSRRQVRELEELLGKEGGR